MDIAMSTVAHFMLKISINVSNMLNVLMHSMLYLIYLRILLHISIH